MTENKKRTGAIIKLTVWCVVLVVLVSIFAAAMTSNKVSFGRNDFMILGGTIYDDSDTYEVGDREYSGILKDIDIDWTSGEVKLVVYDGEEIKLEEDYNGEDRDLMRSKLVGGRLVIKYCRSGLRFFSSLPQKSLTVYIPKVYASELGKIKISTASAEISLATVTAQRLDIDLASGGISVTDSVIDEVDIDGASAEINIEGSFNDIDVDTASGGVRVSGQVGKLEVDSASGDLLFDGGTVQDLSVGSASGGCKVTVEKLPDSIEFDTASGDMELFAPCAEDEGFVIKCESASGEAHTKGLDGQSSSGKSLTFRKEAYKYKLESASGNFYYTETE